MELKAVQEKFIEIYGGAHDYLSFHAPGRVNLIGEHIDYNGGYVFPCALSLGTYGVIRKRNDRVIKFASTNISLRVTCDAGNIVYDEEDGWANYLKGVIDQFIKKDITIGGFELLIDSNIPNGAGLSSSSSIDVLMSIALNELFDGGLDMLEMIKLSQRAENEFMGVSCGIMDQFSIGMGKKDNAILLDCNTLEYEYVPFVLDGYKLVVGNTKKRRGLADSKYNERCDECARAVAALNRKLNIKYLCELSAEEFEQNKHLIDDLTVRNRAEHAVYENRRVLEAVKKLRAGDICGFGKLLNESHESLKSLYEVTGFELDTLVSESQRLDGVAGSRMTGAGFGGCTVSVVKDTCVSGFIKTAGDNYYKKTGLEPEFYIADVGDGARLIE